MLACFFAKDIFYIKKITWRIVPEFFSFKKMLLYVQLHMICSISFLVTHFFVKSCYTKWSGLKDQWPKSKTLQTKIKQNFYHPSESVYLTTQFFVKNTVPQNKVSSLFLKIYFHFSSNNIPIFFSQNKGKISISTESIALCWDRS